MEQMVTKKSHGISPVWILPIVALLIGSWLVYKGYQDRGIPIVVYFEDGSGITPGKTEVMFKGIPVGMVKDIEVTPNLKQVAVHVEMVKESENRIVKDMQFWVVRPEVSTRQISGLETIVGGSYIGVLPGKSKKPSRVFTGLAHKPPLASETPGIRLSLISPDTAGLDVGSPVYFKKIQVGEVLSVKLAKDSSQVEIKIIIYDSYRMLVNKTSVFWKASGISLDANLTRIKFQVDSLTSLLSGGISFDSRKSDQPLDAQKKQVLHDSRSDALLARGIRLTFQFPSAEGVNPGAAIRYRGVDVGEIVEVTFNDSTQSMSAIGYAYDKAYVLFKDKTYAWMVVPQVSLSGIDNLDAVVRGSYISIEPGGTKPRTAFAVNTSPPINKDFSQGITIKLRADRPGSLGTGSPVYYRQIPIGQVLYLELGPDSRKVDIYVGIERKYSALVRARAKFWNVSGVRVSGGLMSEMTVVTESLQAFVRGGISMALPDDPGDPVTPGAVFSLDADPVEGWEKWSPEIRLTNRAEVKKSGKIKKGKVSQTVKKKPVNPRKTGKK